MVLVVNTVKNSDLIVVRHMKREVIAAKRRSDIVVIRTLIGHRTPYAGVKMMTLIGKVSIYNYSRT